MILGACQESCLEFHNCQRCHENILGVLRKIYRQVVVHLNILFQCRQIREMRRIYNSLISGLYLYEDENEICPLISGVSFVAGKATAEHTIFIKQAISPLNIRHKFCFVFCWNIRSIWRVAKFLVIDVNEVSTIEQFSPLVSEEGVHWKRPLLFWSWEIRLWM